MHAPVSKNQPEGFSFSESSKMKPQPQQMYDHFKKGALNYQQKNPNLQNYFGPAQKSENVSNDELQWQPNMPSNISFGTGQNQNIGQGLGLAGQQQYQTSAMLSSMNFLMGFMQSPFQQRLGIFGGNKNSRSNHFKMRALPEKYEEHQFDSNDFKMDQNDTPNHQKEDKADKNDFMDKEFSRGSPQMMGPADYLQEMSPFPYILTASAGQQMNASQLRDKTIKESMLKKQQYESEFVNRSSGPSDELFALPTAAQQTAAFVEYYKLKKGETNVEQLMEEIRNKLKKQLDLPEGTGIFLTSSEQDAQFIPILIGKALGNQKVINIITQEEITDKDTLSAAYGEYFSETQPITGYLKKGEIFKNKPIKGLSFGLNTVVLRSHDDHGYYVDNYSKLQEQADKCYHGKRIPIIHLMQPQQPNDYAMDIHEVLSKKEFQLFKGIGGIPVINYCDGIVGNQKIWNDPNSIIIMAGSKYHKGPNGATAVFVPPLIMKKLQDLKNDGPYFPPSMNSFFGKNEFPRELPKWRDAVNDNQNPGLALRWVSALIELELTMKVSCIDMMQATYVWSSEMRQMIIQEPMLTHSDSHDKQYQAKVNINIQNYIWKNGSPYLDEKDLNLVAKAMAMDLSEVIDWNKDPKGIKIYGHPTPSHANSTDDEYWKDVSSKIFLVGKPKRITKESQFSLEISLGNIEVCKIAEDLKLRMSTSLQMVQQDQVLLRKLSFIAHNFFELKTNLKKLEKELEFKISQVKKDNDKKFSQYKAPSNTWWQSEENESSKQAFTFTCETGVCSFAWEDDRQQEDQSQEDYWQNTATYQELQDDIIDKEGEGKFPLVFTYSSNQKEGETPENHYKGYLSEKQNEEDNIEALAQQEIWQQIDNARNELETLYQAGTLSEKDFKEMNQQVAYADQLCKDIRSDYNSKALQNKQQTEPDAAAARLAACEAKAAAREKVRDYISKATETDFISEAAKNSDQIDPQRTKKIEDLEQSVYEANMITSLGFKKYFPMEKHQPGFDDSYKNSQAYQDFKRKYEGQSTDVRNVEYASGYENSEAYKAYMGSIKNNDKKPENVKQAIEDMKEVIKECIKMIEQDEKDGKPENGFLKHKIQICLKIIEDLQKQQQWSD